MHSVEQTAEHVSAEYVPCTPWEPELNRLCHITCMAACQACMVGTTHSMTATSLCYVQTRKKLDPLAGTDASRKSLEVRKLGHASSSSDSDTTSSSHVPTYGQPASDIELGSAARNASSSPQDAADSTPDSRWGASYFSQIAILLSRTLKTRRFEALGRQDVCQFIIVGVLSGGGLSCAAVHMVAHALMWSPTLYAVLSIAVSIPCKRQI